MKNLFILLVVFFVGWMPNKAVAVDGHKISVKLEQYPEKEIYLAYHYGDKQYIRDTVAIGEDRWFVFEGGEKMESGVYLIVMPPDNNFIQILVDKDQEFSVTANAKDPLNTIHIEGSVDNKLFYEYMSFLNGMRPKAEKLRSELEAVAEDEKKKKKLQEEMDKLDGEVKDFQLKLIKEHPASLTAAIIKANMPIDQPEFVGDEKEIQEKRWRYMQKHYFDNINLADPRLLRTPFFFQRVDHFVHKLQVQHPDTIIIAIDQVLGRMKPAEENFKFYLIHFLNTYAQSKIVGMDAVYVHLVEKYYATGMAPWTEPEQLEKIIDNANELKPLLIGKIAPDIKMQTRDGKSISLHEVDAPYTILYFWRYDCGHCKKSTPDMKAFYEKFKDRGVEIFAVCAKFRDEVPECWEYIDDNAIGDWLHTVDPNHRSRYGKIYSVKTTPQLYILDHKKEILSKRIGADQLEEVMDRIIEMNKKDKADD